MAGKYKLCKDNFNNKPVKKAANESKSIKEANKHSNNYKNYLELVFKTGNILKLRRSFEFFSGGVSKLDDIEKAVIDAAPKFVSYDHGYYLDKQVKIIFPTGTEFEAIKLEKVEDNWYDYLVWFKEVSTGALVPIDFEEGEDLRDLFSGIPEYKLDNKSDEIDIEEVEDDLYFRGMRGEFGAYEDTVAYEMTDRAEDIFGMDHDTAYDLAWKIVSRMKDNGFEFEDGEAYESIKINESKGLESWTDNEIADYIINRFKNITGIKISDVYNTTNSDDALIFDQSVIDKSGDKLINFLDRHGITGKRQEDLLYLIDDKLTMLQPNYIKEYLAPSQLKENKFNEDYSDEVVTLSRYLDVEVPDICREVLDLIEHLPSHKISYATKICRDFYANMESIIKNYTTTGDNFDI